MAVGVTTFISASLARGKRFAIGGSLDSRAGLSIGRTTDMLVRRVVNDSFRLDYRRKDHRRAREFFSAMAAAKITVTEVQRKCTLPDLHIRTEVDAMGVDKERRQVAIELKTTQHSKAAFSAAYFTACKNQPTLTNGLPNCLYWRHQLQCAFGVLATNSQRGVVAVMCEDGSLVYDVVPTALDRSLFVGAVSPEATQYCPLLPYPEHADEELTAALKKKLHYTKVVAHNPTVVRGAHGDAVLLLVRKGNRYKGSKAAAGHRARARQLAARHSAAAVIGWLEKGVWRFNTVVRRKVAASV